MTWNELIAELLRNGISLDSNIAVTFPDYRFSEEHDSSRTLEFKRCLNTDGTVTGVIKVYPD